MVTLSFTAGQRHRRSPSSPASPVSTWSEEWKEECEARAILAMSKEQRDAFFNGRKDPDGRSIDRGVIGVRGVKAAEEIPTTMERLLAARGR